MTPLDCLSPITTMIFLSLMPARQGVDNWSAMRSSRASFSIRSDSSGWPNLKPSASAGPVVREASATSIANARLDRTSLASYVAVFTVFFAFLVEGDTVLATSLVAPEPVLDAVFVALRAAPFGTLRVAPGG